MGLLALFDLDDTLIELAPAFRRFAQDFARGFALSAEAEEWLVEAWDPRQKRDAFFARVRERYGLAEPVEDLWRLYRSRMPEYVELRDEVRDGLVAMRRAGWRLGIVTNGEADNQLGKVERTGLGRLVDSVVVSGALGIRKPDAQIFRIAADSAGRPLTDGGWMVGDDAHADIEGGAAVGLRTVWIGADGAAAPRAATATVKDVVEAFPLLLTCR
ncbi:HAD superfamily hydrolase (TIGR01549 family) [Catenulispora sp. EB89]|uniref:HAD family hydrolase n=1 Tax=Catenulispora sp. EB89 TaxID=3156257 RepID=UPI003515937B